MRETTTFIIVIIMAFFFPSCAANPSADDEQKVISLSYHETACSSIPNVWFDFRMDENTGTLTNCSGRFPMEALRAQVPAEVADSLSRIVKEEKMKRYKDHYKPFGHVLDGWQWNLHIRFANGSSCGSSGHMRRPGGNGLQRLEEYLNSVWAQVDETKADTVNIHDSEY